MRKTMAEAVFLLCALMSTACTVALYKGYGKTRNKLLLYGAICFFLLALNNIFICVDLILLPEIELNGPFWRNFLTASAGCALLSGLIAELS